MITKSSNTRQNLALIGMTGCGKSTVGRALSNLSGMDFVDLDDEIVKGEGKTPRELFDEYGEEYFRKKEHEYFKAALERENTVISCGGGIVLLKENRELLKQVTTVRIIRPLHLVEENTGVFSRPPINGKRENYLRIYEERTPLYRATADLSVYNTDSEKCAEELFSLLQLKKCK